MKNSPGLSSAEFSFILLSLSFSTLLLPPHPSSYLFYYFSFLGVKNSENHQMQLVHPHSSDSAFDLVSHLLPLGFSIFICKMGGVGVDLKEHFCFDFL